MADILLQIQRKFCLLASLFQQIQGFHIFSSALRQKRKKAKCFFWYSLVVDLKTNVMFARSASA